MLRPDRRMYHSREIGSIPLIFARSLAQLRRTSVVLLLVLSLASSTLFQQDVHAQTPAEPSPLPLPASATVPLPESTPLRAWYFAEGNSRNGFETYFTLLNLSDQPAGVTALYNRD